MESDHSLRSSLGHPESSLAGGSGSSESSKKPQALGKSLRRRPKNSKPDIPPEDSDGKQGLVASIPPVGAHFNLVSKIGEGTFSSVYLATLKKDSSEKVAIKHLVPTSIHTRLENEIYCLKTLGGQDHVISLHAYIRQEDHVALIMPYFQHDKFVDILQLMGVAEARGYMRALFEALCKIHSHGIIHRDIKPSNFLYNRATKEFQLVDFGLAHSQTQTKEDKGSILKAQTRAASSGPAPHTSPPPAKQPDASVSMAVQRPSSKSLRQPLRVKSRPLGANRGPSLSASAALGLQGKRGAGGGAQRLGGAAAAVQGTVTGLQRKRGATPAMREAVEETPGKRVARDTSGLQGKHSAVGAGGRAAGGPRGVTAGLGSATGLRAGAGKASTLQGKRGGMAGALGLRRKQGGIRDTPPRLNRKRGGGMGEAPGHRGESRGTSGAETEERESIRICPVRHDVNFVCKLCMARNNQVAPRAGTPGFRPPEVLLKYPNQTTAVDMWSAGIILLCLLSKRYPFFKAHDDMSAMAQIVGLFGSKRCIEAARSCGKDLIALPETPPLDLKDLCATLRSHTLSCDHNSTSHGHDRRRQPNSGTQQKRHRSTEKGIEEKQSPSKKRKLNSKLRTKSEPILPRGEGSGSRNGNQTRSECDSCSWNQVPDSVFDLMSRCLDLNPHTRITAEQCLQHPYLT